MSRDAEPSPLDAPFPEATIRTHLANERTFLAWARTGITSIALGLGAAQLLDPHELAGIQIKSLLAGVFIVFGFIIVVLGRWRYRQTAIGIRDETYRTHRRALEIVLLGAFVMMVIAMIFVAQA